MPVVELRLSRSGPTSPSARRSLFLVYVIAFVLLGVAPLSRGEDWLKTFGGPLDDAAKAVAIDSFGDICVVGSFQYELRLGSLGRRLISTGKTDAVVARYNHEGTLLWVTRLGGSGSDSAVKVAADDNGDCYVIGYFEGKMEVEKVRTESRGGRDVYVAKLQKVGGRVEWVTTFGGIGDDDGHDIACSTNGSLLITGSFHRTVDFGSTRLTASGASDAFVAKLDASNGYFLSAVRLGGGGADAGRSIAVDKAAPAVYVTGAFVSLGVKGETADMMHLTEQQSDGGPQGSHAAAAAWRRRQPDAFVARLSLDNLATDWVVSYGGPGRDWANSVVVDDVGSVYVGGSFSETVDFGGSTQTAPELGTGAFVLKLEGQSGAVLWAQTWGAPFMGDVRLAVGSDGGGVYAAGHFLGKMHLPGYGHLESVEDGYDLYLVKIDKATGGVVQAYAGGNRDWQYLGDVAMHSSGDAVLVGAFEDKLSFGGLKGNYTETQGKQDAFVVRFGEKAKHLSGAIDSKRVKRWKAAPLASAAASVE